MLLNFNSNVFSNILVSNFLLLSHRNFIFEKKTHSDKWQRQKEFGNCDRTPYHQRTCQLDSVLQLFQMVDCFDFILNQISLILTKFIENTLIYYY
jgi:hypothetical protein